VIFWPTGNSRYNENYADKGAMKSLCHHASGGTHVVFSHQVDHIAPVHAGENKSGVIGSCTNGRLDGLPLQRPLKNRKAPDAPARDSGIGSIYLDMIKT
jgi:homoaconitase/3-isopropylmalate dehydratase large subunit